MGNCDGWFIILVLIIQLCRQHPGETCCGALQKTHIQWYNHNDDNEMYLEHISASLTLSRRASRRSGGKMWALSDAGEGSLLCSVPRWLHAEACGAPLDGSQEISRQSGGFCIPHVPSTAKAYLTGVALAQICCVLLSWRFCGAPVGRRKVLSCCQSSQATQPDQSQRREHRDSDQCVAKHPGGYLQRVLVECVTLSVSKFGRKQGWINLLVVHVKFMFKTLQEVINVKVSKCDIRVYEQNAQEDTMWLLCADLDLQIMYGIRSSLKIHPSRCLNICSCSDKKKHHLGQGLVLGSVAWLLAYIPIQPKGVQCRSRLRFVQVSQVCCHQTK